MNRHATIAIVWLLPPLLFWGETTTYPWPRGPGAAFVPYGVGLAATLCALIGAVLAARGVDAASGPNPITKDRFPLRLLIASAVSICVIATAFFCFAADEKSLNSALGAIFIATEATLLASIPLWAVKLFRHMGTRLAARSLAAVALVCCFPFALFIAGDLAGRRHGPVHFVGDCGGGPTIGCP